jgi:hypothetical protein
MSRELALIRQNISLERQILSPLIPSFPLTGKDKGRGDWSDKFPSTPIPIKGKEVQAI